MKNSISLSYILTTVNKVEYLKVTLPLLINACKEDEEIVIVDGGSTDGTYEYLSSLKEANKIHQLYSEKDFGEAHGTNKALMLSKGTLIKIITDDDAYSYHLINDCKNFMFQNPDVDILGSNGFYYNSILLNQIQLINKDSLFTEWKTHKQPFLFTGLSLLIRRSSLPLVGLFDTNFMIVDYEYTSRITAGKAKLAWYTGYTFVNIISPHSNSRKHLTRLYQEKQRLQKFYKIKSTSFSHYYIKTRSTISNWIRRMFIKEKNPTRNFNFNNSFIEANKVLAQYEQTNNPTFLQ